MLSLTGAVQAALLLGWVVPVALLLDWTMPVALMRAAVLGIECSKPG